MLFRFLRSTMHAAGKFFLLITFIGAIGQISLAQNLPTGQRGKQIDSLLSVLKTAKEDTGKVNTLNTLSDQLWRTDNYPQAMKYADSALILSEKLDLPDGSHGFKKGIANSYINIGNVYKYQGNYPEALKKYLTSLKISEEIGDKNEIAACYNNLWGLNIKLNSPAEAKKYWYRFSLAACKTKSCCSF